VLPPGRARSRRLGSGPASGQTRAPALGCDGRLRPGGLAAESRSRRRWRTCRSSARGSTNPLLRRFTGHRQAAQDLQAALVSVTTTPRRDARRRSSPRITLDAGPRVVLPSRPSRPSPPLADTSASARTTFDQWADTRSGPTRRCAGGRCCWSGTNEKRAWRQALRFDQAEPLGAGRWALPGNSFSPPTTRDPCCISGGPRAPMDISIILPIHNGAREPQPLLAELGHAMDATRRSAKSSRSTRGATTGSGELLRRPCGAECRR
jgi:hypothetical protein